MRNYSRSILVAALAVIALPAYAQDISGPAHELAESQIRDWISDPMVINAVKRQNAKNIGLTQAEIDKLDKQWRAETGASSRPLIDSVLGNPLSKHLRSLKASGKGLFTEIFVMDDKGLNVGQSDVTSDYWQGDEEEWQAAYDGGPGSVHVSEVEHDESTQTFQAKIILPIVDPATHMVIGSAAVGVDVEQLTQ